jgi:4-cresol dehydrogenase (hydroxylating)
MFIINLLDRQQTSGMVMNQQRYESAVADWRLALGDDAVITSPDVLQTSTSNCTGISKPILAVIYARQASQVAEIVKIAARHRVAIHPYSTGNNWGYGSKNPSLDNAVLVDLSGLNRIVDFDPDNGLLTIEPGVTQRQLDQFLTQHDYQFLIPVTGAGPDCSLLGNALERGYGMTPYADHFGAVMSLEAVLPNGEIYRSMLTNLGGQVVDKAFKWGMGPYLDGLFSQSNFGIVTQITIALAAKPQRVEAFFFSVKHAEDLEPAVAKVKQLLRQLGPVIGSINLMNKHRMLAMSETYPEHQLGDDGLIPASVLSAMMRSNQLGEWTGAGAIYGSNKIAAAARAEIRKILRPLVSRLIFFTPSSVAKLYTLARALPIVRNSNALNTLAVLNKILQIFAGKPNEVALPLAYWRSGNKPVDGSALNPDRDGCGLIWYAPLLPMQPEASRRYVEMVTAICVQHGIEPLITLTSLSERCWDSSVPILFDRNNANQCANALLCYQALLEAGREQGFIPYRLGSHSMDFPAKHQATPELLKVLKHAVDPQNILAPGRYGL